MTEIRWNALKSERLKKTRGVSFEEIVTANFVGIKKHPSKAAQNLLLFEFNNYIWVVPFVRTDEEIFLKTIYPSRKYTKLYQREQK